MKPPMEPLLIAELSDELTVTILAAFKLATDPIDGLSKMIRCKPCNVIVVPSIDGLTYDKWLTVEEQEHMATEEHRANTILVQLSGEDTGK